MLTKLTCRCNGLPWACLCARNPPPCENCNADAAYLLDRETAVCSSECGIALSESFDEEQPQTILQRAKETSDWIAELEKGA